MEEPKSACTLQGGKRRGLFPEWTRISPRVDDDQGWLHKTICSAAVSHLGGIPFRLLHAYLYESDLAPVQNAIRVCHAPQSSRV